MRLQVAERIYQDFTLTAQGMTGHSSVPQKNIAIYKLAKALDRLSGAEPDYRLLPVTRAYFRQRAALEKPGMSKAMLALANSTGPLPRKALKIVAENPQNATTLSTSCVATMLSGGTRVNALPAEASANVKDCRILPDESVEQIREPPGPEFIHDPEVKITLAGDLGAAGPSPVDGVVPSAIAEVSKERWPGAPVIPTMQPGATDSRFLRARGVASYGLVPWSAPKRMPHAPMASMSASRYRRSGRAWSPCTGWCGSWRRRDRRAGAGQSNWDLMAK